MLNVITKTFVFVGTAAKILSTISGAPERCSRLTVEPDSANTHQCYVGSAAMVVASLTGIIKQIAKPAAADAVLDSYDLDVKGGSDQIATAQFAVAGTDGEACRISFYVG